MAKRHISITNDRVLKAFDKATKENKGSRLIEEAVLYYLDSIEKDYITKEEVNSMILEALRNIEIKNPNYTSQDLDMDIQNVLDL